MSIKETIITAAIGANGKEATVGGMVAIVGSAMSVFLGGWDITLKLLIYAMIADYATGLLGAVKQKKVNSEVMFWGGVRKGVILLVIGLAVMLDQLMGNDSPVFRTLALYFYIGREGISILENFGHIGVAYPAFFKQIMEQLNERGNQSGKL
ncbi:holin [Brevibacillus nitrificans]|uniref:Holin n=1 Tax=Brevibacillus nitrificans TaxID=651560 RepID=A0A3M8DPS8_9BACL|nr:phage holin family protein [Brevibacillus nitrificans]RNB90146.1 holin [Brevibacillus nitrificans]